MLASFLCVYYRAGSGGLQPPLDGYESQNGPHHEADGNAPDHSTNKTGIVFRVLRLEAGFDVRSEFFFPGRIEHHSANCDLNIHEHSAASNHRSVPVPIWTTRRTDQFTRNESPGFQKLGTESSTRTFQRSSTKVMTAT